MEYEQFKAILFIYIGTVFYALASFYHLSFKEWNLVKALLVAIPLVIIEYLFSLNGNRKLNELYKINPLSILIITISFYFVNIWLLNLFVLKNNINFYREIIAFILIIIAFLVSSNMVKTPF
jgi:uncharacterized protein (DUF486 family)